MRALNKIKVPLMDVNDLAIESSSSISSPLLPEEQVSKLKCPSCGTELKDSFQYCANCGMRIPK